MVAAKENKKEVARRKPGMSSCLQGSKRVKPANNIEAAVDTLAFLVSCCFLVEVNVGSEVYPVQAGWFASNDLRLSLKIDGAIHTIQSKTRRVLAE